MVRDGRLELPAWWSQTTRATNCANPGYSIFLHDTMLRKKKQVFRVCGQRCGQARFFGSFSTGEFPPQATVPRTSGISLSGEWMSRLSTQITCATNCATPGYSVFLHDTMRRKKKQVFRVCRRWYDLWQIIRTSSKHKLSSTLRPYRPNILCGLFWSDHEWIHLWVQKTKTSITGGKPTDIPTRQYLHRFKIKQCLYYYSRFSCSLQ